MSSLSDALAISAGLALMAIVWLVLWKVFQSLGRSWRRRRTLVAARRLLRSDRPSADQRWSIEDWDWALLEVGTESARELVASSDRLLTGRPRLRLVR